MKQKRKQWKDKPIYGEYSARSKSADLEMFDSYQWLCSAGLKTEMKVFFLVDKINAW